MYWPGFQISSETLNNHARPGCIHLGHSLAGPDPNAAADTTNSLANFQNRANHPQVLSLNHVAVPQE